MLTKLEQANMYPLHDAKEQSQISTSGYTAKEMTHYSSIT